MSRRQRGMVLGLVLMTSIVFAMMAYAALVWALTRARTAPVTLRRLQARYAAEGGLAWAMQRLYRTPSWTSGVRCGLTWDHIPQECLSPPTPCDLNDPPTSLTNGLQVDVVICPCHQAPCENRTLQAKVVY